MLMSAVILWSLNEKKTLQHRKSLGKGISCKISLRIIYKFIKNVELVVVDTSKVETMNSSRKKLPPGQIEDLRNVCFDGLVYCNSHNDSHTFESLTNETWQVLFT